MILDLIPLVSAQATGTTISSTAFKSGFQLLIAVVIIFIAAVLFFVSKFVFSWKKQRKNFKVNAVIYNPDGTWQVKRIGKFRTKDNVDKMLFMGSNETMPVIEPRYIRANTVTLFRYAPGQYAVIPPKMWESIDLKKFSIELINMQMKNFAFLEQRAAVSRWAYIKDLLNRWGPYLTLLVICITSGVIIWFMMKLGYNIFSDAVIARTLECKQLIGQSTPTA